MWISSKTQYLPFIYPFPNDPLHCIKYNTNVSTIAHLTAFALKTLLATKGNLKLDNPFPNIQSNQKKNHTTYNPYYKPKIVYYK